MTVLIHVGAAKSGTTSLQQNVFARLENIAFVGKPYGDRQVYEHLEALKWRDEADFDAGPLREIVSELRAEALAGNQSLVLSEESLTSPPMKSLVAERLRTVFGDAKILLTIRNQYTSIESYYARQGRILRKVPAPWAGRHVAFNDWFDFNVQNMPGGHLDRIRYATMLDIYAAAFGRENIHVLLFEEMTGAPETVAAELAGLLNVDADAVLDCLREPPENTRTSGRARAVHQLESGIPGFIRTGARILPRPVKDGTKTLIAGFRNSGPRDRIVITQDRRNRIAEIYAPENRRLSAEWGIDVESHGYPV